MKIGEHISRNLKSIRDLRDSYQEQGTHQTPRGNLGVWICDSQILETTQIPIFGRMFNKLY